MLPDPVLWLHKLKQKSESIIKREDWSRGYALLVFDLTPDFNNGDHYSGGPR